MKEKYSKENLEKAVMDSISMASCMEKLNISGGGAKDTIQKYIEKYNISTSHWLGQGHNKGKNKNKYSDDHIKSLMIINGNDRDRRLIKRYLLNNKILKYNCSICDLSSWLDKPITLQIDHINGIRTDHRLENLRLLCPNCHSQTSTYCAKNKKNSKLNNVKTLCRCGTQIKKPKTLCNSCKEADKIENPKYFSKENIIKNIPKEDLIKDYLTLGKYELANKLEMSKTCLHKHLSNLGILDEIYKIKEEKVNNNFNNIIEKFK